MRDPLTERLPPLPYLGLFVALAASKAVLRYRQIDSPRDLFFDAREVWYPLARAVSSGASLYTAVPDNKPPLFQFLNLLVYATGEYVVVFTLLLALANVLTAVLVYRLCVTRDLGGVGLVASTLFLLVTPLGWAQKINPRQFAIVGVLAALLLPGAVAAGVAVAVAGLFTQYAALSIPVVLWLRFRENRLTRGYVSRFGASGLVVVAAAFVAVGVIWTPSAAIDGVRQSVLASGQYVTSQPDSPTAAPRLWIRKVLGFTLVVLPVMLFAGVGLLTELGHFDSLSPRRTDLVVTCVALASIFSVQYVARAGGVYMLLLLPFLSILAGLGIERMLRTGG